MSLDDDAATLVALYEVRADLRDDFDRAEAALIAKMEGDGKKRLELGDYSLTLEPRPVTACRSCGQALERPDWVPKEFSPKRIRITKSLKEQKSA